MLPKAVPANQIDPLAGANFPGSSAQRVAKPVGLPFERTLSGPVTDWVLLAVDGLQQKEYYLQFKALDQEGYPYAQRRGRASNGMKPMWLLANKRAGQGLGLMLALSQTGSLTGREVMEQGLAIKFPHKGAAALVEIKSEK